MKLLMHGWRLWGALWLLVLGLFGAPAALAQDYTQGVEVSGTTATLWFKSNVATSWVDAHYSLNNGAQQNVRMTAANGRYELKLTVASGNVIGYWFTYNNGSPAYDTPRFSYTVNGNTATGPVCFFADVNYTGASSCVSADSGWIGSAWNDRISSVKVAPGYRVTLFNDINFGGSSLALTGDEPNLVNRGFNDLASSYRVATNGGSWNGRTTFNIVNQTRGRWADDQVYWAIIGRDWATGRFVRVDAAGNLIPMSVADNGALSKNGVTYSNYFHRLSNTRSVTIPALDSARIMLSVGSPMYIRVVVDGNGNVGYAGANIENPTDPNIDVYFDFGEMAILPQGHPNQGIFINTTRVDHFGFPLKLRVQGLGGFDQTVGEALAETRDQLFSHFQAEVPAQFRSLAQAPHAPYRIIAPAHATFKPGQVNANYLQPYIDAMWARYRNEDLVFTLQNLGTFRGRVNGDRFIFTGGSPAGTFYINGKPDTAMVLLGAGLLADASGNPTNIGTQLQIQAQVCAALNRHVLQTPANWYVQNAHHPAGQLSNWYSKFWHDHSINRKAYGFAYDDVGDFSPSIHTSAPTVVTYTIGW
ncbi:beta-1,3-glucanase family protein [Pelomonas sp. UHG3]|uniref:Beta-1,3-glucanase family protein n=1 Tax=Roseateles hydrophilus TaxID=2975054 RepID=A0ACC6CDP3_9BURK|nr:beta-1,3-glucanase family protein [Pelomonas sp. UHG3]MCY4746551.1 beta-1,3-glucanase family protein [Pelomonas sp. UHG3]